MLGLWPLLAASLLWAGMLFAVALWGERPRPQLRRWWPWIYSLSLAVYCTAWTFYGTVTQATRWGSPVTPTFIGTIALFLFGLPLLLRLAALARAQNSASLADLVAARFGKSSALAAVLTLVAVVGMVPYVALQLKAVAQSFALLAGQDDGGEGWRDAALWVALLMSAFAMLFGTRRAAATAHNQGLVLAMAVESLLKLAAMAAIGVFVLFGLFEGPGDLLQRAQVLPPASPGGPFVALVLLGALAMLTLPHQFHVGIVELRDPRHLRTARWVFTIYLLLITLPTLPLAWAGQLLIGTEVDSDLHVLALPLAADQPWLALVAFLGGLSAATGMVVVAALTLSIMIAQHWLAPLLLRSAGQGDTFDLRPQVLAQRRLAIAGVMLLAWAYGRGMAESDALADIGALSFSALAQLGPAVIAAVYRPRLPARAVLVGVIVGTLVWAWCLLRPALWPDAAATDGSLWADPLLLGTTAALAANILSMLLLARWGDAAHAPKVAQPALDDLRRLAARLLPAEEWQPLFDAPAERQPGIVERVEHALAGVVGGASARLLVQAAAGDRQAPLETVAEVVGQTTRALRFNQRVLEAALENMSQGISVVDGELRLVAWNRRYAELFDFPADLLRVGVPVAELVRHNAARGLLAGADQERQVQRRMQHMQAGTPYVTERRFPNGQVVEIRGNPLPGGGFVATFTDVTAFRAAEAGLTAAKATLEQRVAQRTGELAAAKAEAERANQAKSRFLAAVSHDLAQPIHAAHLFTHALSQRVLAQPVADSVQQIDGALASAESLLAGLLDISRLDAGGLRPAPRDFPLDEWLAHLASEFSVLAGERGLRLRWVSSRAWVRSDPQLLRRVLQNFLANAVRYTDKGSVLLGCRRRGAGLWLEVHDTGPGIAEADQAVIFEEFRRLGSAGPGLGLGLAIARRMADLLGHPLQLRSRPGRGTVFAVRLDRVATGTVPAPPNTVPGSLLPAARLLAVDNDPVVLEAMRSLLQSWSCQVEVAGTVTAVEALLAVEAPPHFDALLLDYHLDGALTALDLLPRLRQRLGPLPVVVITADHSEAVRQSVIGAGAHLLHKPLRPLALQSLLARLLSSAGPTR
ncbi:MAG: PAS domain-containing hybrid sensor histidine kinase/response regulator [Xanthomonadales bacterium]|nr:PAS domain-containing hybrid sensor histidine kinase/response regulator [Xanthomonadales bacterium]